MQTLVEKAISIALKAHAGQIDKAGAPYIMHPLRLMMQMKTENEMLVAVLHDVVEDSDTTLEDLKIAGFPDEVLQAVNILTHRETDSYEQYLAGIKPNPLARAVKLADLHDNSQLSRIKTPLAKDFQRIEKYRKAISFLNL